MRAFIIVLIACVLPVSVWANKAAPRLSPFMASQAASVSTVGNGYKPNSKRQKQLLEHFDLDHLQYVGLIRQSDKNWGLIQDEKGKVHTVHVGSYIGKHDGKIMRISRQKLVLEQWLPKGRGQYQQEQFEMNLK